MNLKKVITSETITLDLKADTKEGVIAEMIDLLVAAGKIKGPEAREKALAAILEREKKLSTGMQNGIAIPHGKTDAVDTLVTAMAIKRAGMDFGALDGKPTYIFIMTISPDNRTGPHIQFLAEVSRQLNNPVVRERVVHAATREELIHAILN